MGEHPPGALTHRTQRKSFAVQVDSGSGEAPACAGRGDRWMGRVLGPSASRWLPVESVGEGNSINARSGLGGGWGAVAWFEVNTELSRLR